MVIDRRQRQSRLFGFFIGLSVFVIVIAVLMMVRFQTYKEYRNAPLGIKIKYPEYWRVVENPSGGGALVAFLSPKQTGLDTFLENVNISYVNLENNPMTLTQFSQETMSQLEGTLKGNIRVLLSRPVTLANRRGYFYVYKGVGENITNPMKYAHAWLVDGNDAYIVTYAGLEDEFNKHWREYKAMLRSFKVEKPKSIPSS
ncbi:MAG: hypothetical protein NUV91_10200 [Candidatus Omnitrophica bacterium]|nr:hypothetical protein [Candidatus Omnitrophota bacterium]